MSFYINKETNWYLGDTSIENIFINEYMVSAPGDYVKVYLFARMYAQIDSSLTNTMIAMELKMDDEDVLKAWNYWESKGAIRKHYPKMEDKFNYDVEFLSLKTGTGRVMENSIELEESSFLADEMAQGLFRAIERQIGRTLNPKEMESAEEWMSVLGADPEVIVYAYKVAQEKGITTSKYVGVIVRNWIDEGLKNADDVEKYLNDTNERRYLYRRVFKALGFERNWTEKEKKMMDVWFDDYGFSIDKVISACDKSSGISNPNINYVNKILSNWNEEIEKKKRNGESTGETAISNSQVLKYYEYIRSREEKEAKERTEEVLDKIPRMRDIEQEIKKLNVELTKLMFSMSGNDRDQKMENIKKSIEDLNVKKAILLTDNDFPAGYMEIAYKCDKCQDTGVTPEGVKCICFSERAKEASLWQKNQK